MTQGTKSITTYFTQFRGLIDELDNLAPIPRCTCSAVTCTCHNNQNLNEYEKMMKLSQFLMGLSEQFTNTRGQILLMNPFPDLSQAYAMLLQEENQRDSTAHNTVNHESMAINVQAGAYTGNKSRNPGFKKSDKKSGDPSVVCDYCALTGHTRYKCFALHGYPEWHRLYGQPKPKIRSANTKKADVAAHVITQDKKFEHVSSPDGTNSETLSDAQFQQFLQMMQ